MLPKYMTTALQRRVVVDRYGRPVLSARCIISDGRSQNWSAGGGGVAELSWPPERAAANRGWLLNTYISPIRRASPSTSTGSAPVDMRACRFSHGVPYDDPSPNGHGILG